MHHTIVLEQLGVSVLRVPILGHAGATLVRQLAARKYTEAASLLEHEPRFSAKFAPDGRVHVAWDDEPLFSVSGQEFFASRANEGSRFWITRAADAIRKLGRKPWDERGWTPDDDGHG